jgi:hypothetical protein
VLSVFTCFQNILKYYTYKLVIRFEQVSSADSSATGVGSLPINDDTEEMDTTGLLNQQQVQQQSESSSKAPPALCRRSRTDSIIIYTPPTITEAPGSTFYIKRSGEMDYVVLLKVNVNSAQFKDSSHISHLL